MKIYKQKLIAIIVFLIIIIISNHIYIKTINYNFCLQEFKLNNLLFFNLVTAVFILKILKKRNHTFSYRERLKRNFNGPSKEQNNKYEMLLNCIDVGYAYYRFLKDGSGNAINAKAIEINKAFINILGENRESILNYSFSKFIEKYIGDEYDYLKILGKIQKEGRFDAPEYINIYKDKWIGFSIYKIKKEDFAIIITDVSERKKYIDEMKYLANYDSLTDLKNRYSIYNYLADLKRRKKEFAILFMDLDDFGKLNDNLGHDLGDEVLHKVAFILRKYESDSIKIGRLGGDEFLIILEEDISTEHIEDFGQAVLKSINLNFYYNSYSYQIKASLGVSVFDRDSDNIVTLLKYADIAMYHSKKKGGNMLSFFKGEMLENEIKKLC